MNGEPRLPDDSVRPGASDAGRDASAAFGAHDTLRQRFEAEERRHERSSDRISLLRLATFLGAGVLLSLGFAGRSTAVLASGIGAFIAFLIAVVVHRVIVARVEAARARKEAHERHLRRMLGNLDGLPTGLGLLPDSHPYALDIDVVGEGSLFQRIDVTHTLHGAHALADWLGSPAQREAILARQGAVRELAGQPELRGELEAAAMMQTSDGERIDGRPFRAFAELPSYFATHRAIEISIFALPAITLLLFVLGELDFVPGPTFLLTVAAQLAVLAQGGRAAKRAFDLAAARQGTVESFEHMLRLVESVPFKSPLLQALQARISADGEKPSTHLRRLRSWTNAADLRHQVLLHIFINPLTLWDLHVLRGLERWNREVGKRTGDWFAALGELEALSSLATIAFGDPDATLPVIEEEGPLEARELSHPLLAARKRVRNDVAIGGPGCVMLVTGSNMAGKSTLLRALGQNVVLALAGGAVTASSMRLPIVRLRASMRVDDSLQRGASYFHAELTKLRSVIQGAEDKPPVLFLLDEMLRGTNAQARHLGAKAVLVHLLDRGAFGMVATHDVALAALEQERPGRVVNQHFTDVVVDGEMLFDYRLRPGVVRTSNALRLLTLAGIAVPGEGEAMQPALELSDEEHK
jgi:hypothetical protein